MIQFEITENAYITIEHGQQIPAAPRILIESLLVLITACQSESAMDKELTEVIGSIEDWLHMNRVDSLAFDASTRLLRMVAFYYPENNKKPADLNLLQEAEKIQGIPRLTEQSGSFELTPFPYRYYHMAGDLLICFNEAFTLADRLQEVVVSKNLSLFFNKGRYCAWGLYHPETRLVKGIREDVEYASNPFLKISIQEAFNLITDETVSRMFKQDVHCLQQVAALHNRIAAYAAVEESPLGVLKNWLFDLADKFYPKKMVNDYLVKS